jgi:hypothetical protein
MDPSSAEIDAEHHASKREVMILMHIPKYMLNLGLSVLFPQILPHHVHLDLVLGMCTSSSVFIVRSESQDMHDRKVTPDTRHTFEKGLTVEEGDATQIMDRAPTMVQIRLVLPKALDLSLVLVLCSDRCS